MSPIRPRRLSTSCALRVGLLLVLAVAAAVVLAACGSSTNKTTSSSSTNSSRSVQVLYTVKAGDLTDTASGMATLTSTKKGKVTATVAVMGQQASQVAAGQSVTVVFVKLGNRSGGQGVPSGVPSGAASPAAGSGAAPGAGQGSGSGGQGFFGGSGSGALSRLGGKSAAATVTAVQAGSNNSVTATISIARLPSGVTTKYMGIASITIKTLAQNVLIVPRAAIKGSGSGATVQLMENGKTVTQSVTVGQENQSEAEISSGLSAGQRSSTRGPSRVSPGRATADPARAAASRAAKAAVSRAAKAVLRRAARAAAHRAARSPRAKRLH